MKDKTKKGMWKRTIKLYFGFKIPWPLYIIEIVLGIVNTKVALLYVPYETDLKLGNINDVSLVWGYVGFLLLSVAASIAARIPSFYSSAIIERNLQNKLINHSVRIPMRTFEKNGSKIVSWITQDCSFAEGLLSAVIGFITGAVSVFMSVSSMSAIDTTMLFLVPFILVYIIFSTWFEGKMLFLRQRKNRQAMSLLTAYFSEHLSFFTQIKQLHSQKEEHLRGKKAIDQFYKADVYQAVVTLINNFVSGSLTNVITILIFVIGVPRVNSGAITITELAAFQSYILIAYQNLSSVPSLYTSFMYYNGQLFFISKLMAEKEDVYERKHTMDMPDQDIVFEDVSFGYGEEKTVDNISFTIPKGKTTVLVGPNGSGKTTVFKLIERFYTPDEGKIRFGEYDAEDIHLGEWRQSFAYVLQDPQLFDGTVRDNISYGMDREVTDEEIENAAKLACADEFIKELPDGYDFEIGENGCHLSAGQRQRIAIARAVMLDPSYLLLDEATCNMDFKSEKAVTNALSKLMEGRTTVMISHDMNMLNKADHIIVLNEGKIEAEGTREEAEKNSVTLQRLIAANAQ